MLWEKVKWHQSRKVKFLSIIIIYSAALKSVTTYNVCAYFYVCLWINQRSSYNVNIVVIGCNADMETCEDIISGHTFERRAVIINWKTVITLTVESNCFASSV